MDIKELTNEELLKKYRICIGLVSSLNIGSDYERAELLEQEILNRLNVISHIKGIVDDESITKNQTIVLIHNLLNPN